MKKSIKIISIMMIAVIAMFSLAGCGSDEGTDASGDMPTYIAITEPTYAPFESTDDDGNLVGFDTRDSKLNTRSSSLTPSSRQYRQATLT